jgi:hypothetical protein
LRLSVRLGEQVRLALSDTLMRWAQRLKLQTTQFGTAS